MNSGIVIILNKNDLFMFLPPHSYDIQPTIFVRYEEKHNKTKSNALFISRIVFCLVFFILNID
jgi:hypothetical protein